MSGGQLERAMIARALASDAGIIVLDEPDSSLDVDAAAELYELLETLKKEKTILVASHRLEKNYIHRGFGTVCGRISHPAPGYVRVKQTI